MYIYLTVDCNYLGPQVTILTSSMHFLASQNFLFFSYFFFLLKVYEKQGNFLADFLWTVNNISCKSFTRGFVVVSSGVSWNTKFRMAPSRAISTREFCLAVSSLMTVLVCCCTWHCLSRGVFYLILSNKSLKRYCLAVVCEKVLSPILSRKILCCLIWVFHYYLTLLSCMTPSHTIVTHDTVTVSCVTCNSVDNPLRNLYTFFPIVFHHWNLCTVTVMRKHRQIVGF